MKGFREGSMGKGRARRATDQAVLPPGLGGLLVLKGKQLLPGLVTQEDLVHPAERRGTEEWCQVPGRDR